MFGGEDDYDGLSSFILGWFQGESAWAQLS